MSHLAFLCVEELHTTSWVFKQREGLSLATLVFQSGNAMCMAWPCGLMSFSEEPPSRLGYQLLQGFQPPIGESVLLLP